MTTKINPNYKTREYIAKIDDLLARTLASTTPITRLQMLTEMNEDFWKYASEKAKRLFFEERDINLSELEKRVADYKREHQLQQTISKYYKNTVLLLCCKH
jgi:hypothetical protein